MATPEERIVPTFATLLASAVDPDQAASMSAAYTMFHNYSIGNAFAAMWQCHARGIDPGPIASFKAWHRLGRHVKKGSKALVLCMPITVKVKGENAQGEQEEGAFTRFIWRPNWFVLSQTEGKDLPPDALTVPEWSEALALGALKVTREAFGHMNGNAMGYARLDGRTVSVNPLNPRPMRTLFHELAHILMHAPKAADDADAGNFVEHATLTHSEREVEAEAVAYIVSSALGLAEGEGLETSRGYLRHYLGANVISERTAGRIFKTADAILKAGRASAPAEERQAA